MRFTCDPQANNGKHGHVHARVEFLVRDETKIGGYNREFRQRDRTGV